MTVVFPFCQTDAPLAIALLRWIAKLGKWPDYSALIVADAATNWASVKETVRIASDIFGAVGAITNERSVLGWVAGSNSLFQTAARFLERNNRGPWLWLESDATPLRANWLSAIHAEYERCGKPFLGSIVSHDIVNQPNPYFEGNGVYPADCWSRIKDRWSDTVSWTLACTERVIDHAAHTTLIQHVWGQTDLPPSFYLARQEGCPANTMTLDELNPDAVIFHRCKDGSLMRLLANRFFPDSARAERPPTFIQLGRFGDIILLLPAFKEWRDRTGLPTPVISSMEFGTVLEGVSYVQATLMNVNWHHDLRNVIAMTRARNPNAICTQLHGANVGATPDSLPSFSLTMWQRTGMLPLYHELPLVFDLRNRRREQELVDGFYAKRKPLLLVCFESYTSPFDWENNIMQMLHAMGDKFQILRTSAVKAYRVFDLLGLMDVAAGMITIDTMTLHLAAASAMPYIAFVRGDGQSGSIPKGNCVLKIQYHDVPNRMMEIAAVLDGWASKHP